MNIPGAQFIIATLSLWVLSSVQAQTNANQGSLQTPKVGGPASQPSPVRITVTKSFKWQHEVEKKPSVDGKSSRRSSKAPGTLVPKATAVRYVIRVSNESVKVLGNVQVKWAVLLQDDEVKEGQSSGKLGISSDLNVKTDTFPIETEADVKGYVVDVLADGVVIATKQEPAGIKNLIESQKQAESKPKRKKKSEDPKPTE